MRECNDLSKRRGHRDCLGSSNDSRLIDSLATIDNFAPTILDLE